jgi:hypothetical protein
MPVIQAHFKIQLRELTQDAVLLLKARLIKDVVDKSRLVESDIMRVELYYDHANIVLGRIGGATVRAVIDELIANSFPKLLGFYGGSPVEIISVEGFGRFDGGRASCIPRFDYDYLGVDFRTACQPQATVLAKAVDACICDGRLGCAHTITCEKTEVGGSVFKAEKRCESVARGTELVVLYNSMHSKMHLSPSRLLA